ncbi:Mu transposase domain-containing protein [Streptomyces sp. NBC_01268]|uniref:Mu transposase domain-containing protein n=1 Tax=Streptomyces sp. NBC_01268 TaxID=2903806 RepID=UPI003FCE6282
MDAAFITWVPQRRAQAHRTHQQIIGERAARDHAALKPLPENPYLVAERHLRPVGKDCLVAFGGNLYSVPALRVRPRQLVEIRATKSQVMLHSTIAAANGETLLATHPRAIGRGARVVDESHRDGLHKEFAGFARGGPVLARTLDDVEGPADQCQVDPFLAWCLQGVFDPFSHPRLARVVGDQGDGLLDQHRGLIALHLIRPGDPGNCEEEQSGDRAGQPRTRGRGEATCRPPCSCPRAGWILAHDDRPSWRQGQHPRYGRHQQSVGHARGASITDPPCGGLFTRARTSLLTGRTPNDSDRGGAPVSKRRAFRLPSCQLLPSIVFIWAISAVWAVMISSASVLAGP